VDERDVSTGDTGAAPPDIPVSTAHPDLRYQLVDELVADLAGFDPTASIRAAGRQSETRETSQPGPVYRRIPGGEMVVPTGRVLVRFNEGDAAADHQDDLRTIGYVVEQVLPYATHTAWVRAATGGVAAALRDLDRLGDVRGVVAVEPQMIGQRSKRV
jgi:hypothetical protein